MDVPKPSWVCQRLKGIAVVFVLTHITVDLENVEKYSPVGASFDASPRKEESCKLLHVNIQEPGLFEISFYQPISNVS